MKRYLFLMPLIFVTLFFPNSSKAWDISAVSPSGHTLHYNLVNGEFEVATHSNITGDLVIPDSVWFVSNWYRVTSIGEFAFYNCSSLTSVTIPNSVTSIGNLAFNNCSGLTSVTIPNSVTSIGSSAFYRVKHIIYHGTATGSPWDANSINGVVDNDFVYQDSTYATVIGYLGNSTVLTIPNSVTSIGSSAFRGCSSLTSVIIPNSVTSIGQYAFRGCSSLTSVTIPNSVTSIGSWAFYNCSNLTSVTIPNSVTSIESNAFYNVNLIIYCGMASGSPWGARRRINGIVDNDFVYQDSTFTIVVGYLGNNTVLTIPNSVTSIGSSAFEDCSSLTSVIIPNSVANIGEYAFSGCSCLTSVTIPNSVKEIGRFSFSNCYSLSSIIIPDSLESLGSSAFYNNINLNSVLYLASNCEITHVHSPFEGCTHLSDIQFGSNVDKIPSRIFSNCTFLETFTIPDWIKTIGDSVFLGCTNLRDLTIGSSVSSIGTNAFRNCDSLKFIYYNADSCTSVGNDNGTFFGGCGNVQEITIGQNVQHLPIKLFHGIDSVTTVRYNAKNCNNGLNGNCTQNTKSTITSLYLGDSVSVLPNYAFSGFSNIRTINLPASLSTIGSNVFRNCIRLSDTLIIPQSVLSIGENAFAGCDSISTLVFNAENCTAMTNAFGVVVSNITNLSLGNTVRIIPDNAFKNFTGITALSLTDTIQHIGANAFKNCNAITSVYFNPNNSISEIGMSAFNGCSQMAGHLVLPNVSSLGDSAFYQCSMLSSINTGNNLSSIGNSVFKGCDHVTNLTIGRGVMNIAPDAFSGCTEIRLITSRALNPPTIYSGTFDDVDDNISVRVPCTAVDAYTMAPYWSHFENIEGQFDYFFSATSADITRGSVTVVHAPTCDNIEAHIQANPYNGYHFDRWSDGNTQNPRYIVVVQDTVIEAYFEADNPVDVETINLEGQKVYSDNGYIIVENTEKEPVQIFDMTGRQVYKSSQGICRFSVNSSGIYLVKKGSQPVRKISIVR